MRQLSASFEQRRHRENSPVHFEKVKRPELHPFWFSGKQGGEVWPTAFVNRHDLAIQDDGVDGKPSQRASESREPVAQVISLFRKQPDTIALLMRLAAPAVEFDFMHPLVT